MAGVSSRFVRFAVGVRRSCRAPFVANGDGSPYKSLVADDSRTMRTIIRRSLEALGVSDIAEAGDGAQALPCFSRKAFNLVLTHSGTCRSKNGLDLICDIRSQNKQVPIIMITTEAEKSQVLTAIQAGVSDYLVKPFTADVLCAKPKKEGPKLQLKPVITLSSYVGSYHYAGRLH